MTNPYRAMCSELVAAWDDLPWEYDFKGNVTGIHGDLYDDSAVDRARALLAEPVAEGPTDEELLRVAATAIAPYEISGITPGEYEPETECVVEAYGSELIAYAREVLHRFGRPAPQPVAEGPKPVVDYSRVTEIATEAQIRSAAQYLVKKQNCDGDLIPAIEYAIARWGRPTPQPVPVSERLPGPEDCLDEGWAWFFNKRIGWRQAVLPVSPGYTHWLPANALPTPRPSREPLAPPP